MATKPLSETHPALAAEWHPTRNPDLTPDQVSAGSHKRIWWLAECGHEWQSDLSTRTYGKYPQNCPYCGNRKILVGFNDLPTTHPALAAEWHPTLNGDLLVSQISSGSGKKVWWLGTCGHEWQSQIVRRSQRGAGCSVCFGRTIQTGFNDLKTLDPFIASEWHPTLNGDNSPEKTSAGSNKKVWWLGTCGHEWQSSVYFRVSVSKNCPICLNVHLLAGFNDLGTLYPQLASQLNQDLNNGLTAAEISPGSDKKVWWIAECGHEWLTSPKRRVRGENCAICANKQVLKGFNDLKSTYPQLASEWHPTKNVDLSPESISPFTRKKIWWIAECGHEWLARPSGRINGSGCPTCSIGGFRSTEPATLYFLHNPRLQAFKVGITNRDKKVDRLKVFKRQGWLVVNRWESESGLIIVSCEATFFQWIRRDKQIPIYLNNSDLLSTGGASETFSDSIIPEQEVIAKIEELLAQFEA